MLDAVRFTNLEKSYHVIKSSGDGKFRLVGRDVTAKRSRSWTFLVDSLFRFYLF